MVPASKRNFRYFTYIEPVLKTPAVRTYGSLIFTILAMIIFIVFAIKPTIETIVLLQKDLDNQKQVLEKINQKIENLNKGRENFDKIPQETKLRIESLLPKLPDLPGLVRVLEQSVPPGASISAIQFQPLAIERTSQTVIEATLTEIEFTFNIEGTYDALKGTLQNLNNGARLVTIDQLTFNKVDDANGLIMSVSGKAYYLK